MDGICCCSDYLQRVGQRAQYSGGDKLALRVAVHLCIWEASSLLNTVASGKIYQLLSDRSGLVYSGILF